MGAAWTLPKGAGSADVAGRLAAALTAGTPERQGDAWAAGGLRVTGEAGRPWFFYSCGQGIGTPLPPDTPVSSPVAPPVVSPDAPDQTPVAKSAPGAIAATVGCAVAIDSGTVSSGSGSSSSSGSGSSGSGSSGSGGSSTASTGPGTTVVAPAPPADAPQPQPKPAVSGGPVTGGPVPIDGPPPTQDPVAVPVQPTPSKAEVLAAADPVLAAVGLADETARVSVYPGGGSVVVDPHVGGLETAGFSTRVDVDAQGKVNGASGWLGDPAKGDSYPLVSARTAFDAIPMGPQILSCPVSPTGGCQEPVPAEITGAHLGLTPAALADGGAVLLPAWLFEVKGADEPVPAVAVEPRYLATGASTDPSGTGVKPGTDGSSTSGSGTASGQPFDPGANGSGADVPPQSARTQLAFDAAHRAKTADALLVQYGDSSSCKHQNVTPLAKEDATTVYVQLESDRMDTLVACTEDYTAVTVQVDLQAPLGQRKVVDLTTGKQVPVT